MKKMAVIIIGLLFSFSLFLGSAYARAHGGGGGRGGGGHLGGGGGHFGGGHFGGYGSHFGGGGWHSGGHYYSGGPRYYGGGRYYGGWRGGWGYGYPRGYWWGPGFYWGWGWPYYSSYNWGGPYFYSDPYYDYAAPSAAMQDPPEYTDQGQEQPYYWYFCRDPQGYYPHVENCPSGWMQVIPSNPKAAPPSALSPRVPAHLLVNLLRRHKRNRINKRLQLKNSNHLRFNQQLPRGR